MKYRILLLFLFTITLSYSQGSSCNDVQPFCAGGSALTFGNTTGVPSMGAIGCNYSTPNPAWFYMQISEPGDLNFQISQVSNTGTPIDVDFIAWGPFPPGTEPSSICSSLQYTCSPSCPNNTSNPSFYPHGNIVDCSYSAAPTETMTITNAQVGEIYIVLIMNYNGSPGQITLNQTNSGLPIAGATDCNIVCPLSLGEDQVLCPGDSLLLTATIDDATTYEWFFDGNPVGGNTQTYLADQPGTYTVVVNKPGCVADATASITIFPPSNVDLGMPPNLVACEPEPALFNLNDNNSIILNGHSGFLSFHNSLADAQTGNFPIPTATNYSGVHGETIYVSVTISGEACLLVTSFELEIIPCSLFPLPTDIPPLCDIDGDGFEVFDLTISDLNALNGLDSS
ncbi:MAG: hypothetical protein RBR78_09615, partial [Flavobacteriaceae bacterium]|nr:hypothetical protein [Flavobacteriaceae bacterium]